MSKELRSLLFLLLGVGWLIAAFVVLVMYEDFGLTLGCVAMAFCNKLESEK